MIVVSPYAKPGYISHTYTDASRRATATSRSIVTHAKSSKTHVTTTIECTKSSTSFFRIPAGQDMLVSAGLAPGCRAELKAAKHHQLEGKLSSRPRTGQQGLIKLVSLSKVASLRRRQLRGDRPAPPLQRGPVARATINRPLKTRGAGGKAG
jgi:hypothetical protein